NTTSLSTPLRALLSLLRHLFARLTGCSSACIVTGYARGRRSILLLASLTRRLPDFLHAWRLAITPNNPTVLEHRSGSPLRSPTIRDGPFALDLLAVLA